MTQCVCMCHVIHHYFLIVFYVVAVFRASWMFAFNEHLVTGVDYVSAMLWELLGRTEALSPGHPVFTGLVVKLWLMMMILNDKCFVLRPPILMEKDKLGYLNPNDTYTRATCLHCMAKSICKPDHNTDM